MIQSILFILALCTDSFGASLAYGTSRTQVSWGKVLLLNAICSGCLGLSLGAGAFFKALVPEGIARAVCFFCLFSLGSVKLLDSGIRSWIRRRSCFEPQGCSFHFSLSGLKVLIRLYADPAAADADGSRSLGWRETVGLGLAMSIDSLAAGMMAAYLFVPPLMAAVLSFITGTCLMEAGLWLGRRAASRWKCDLSWAGGLMLMGLAVMQVVKG